MDTQEYLRLIKMTHTEAAIDKLKAMSNVFVVKNIISKEKYRFGIVRNKDIFLLDEAGHMQRVDQQVIRDTDLFLMVATRSYWIASNKRFNDNIFQSLIEK